MSGLRAGDLNKFVVVKRRATSKDGTGYGGQSTTWLPVSAGINGGIYVGVEQLFGRELIAGQAVHSEVTHRITARYDAAIWADPIAAAKFRIDMGARIFNLHGVINEDERDTIVRIYASEGLSDG